MGWEIVREQHRNEPGKWSRLWVYEDIYKVLTKIKGTEAIEGIVVDVTHSRDIHERGIMGLHGKSFSAMTNLRLLSISNVHLSENLEYLSSELRIFEWNGYPLKSLPLCFHTENLFELIMCNSCIEYLWEGMKSFLKLKTINLSHSCNLITTPDFTGVPNLETLDLEGCTKLREVHPSVAVLTKLTVFVLKDCRNLSSFPSDIHGLKSLKILNLCGCLKLDKLPENIGEAECLVELDISRTAIRQVSSSIVQLKRLDKLSLHGCNGQRPETWFTFFLSLLLPNKNPDSMCLLMPPLSGLITLKKLNLSDCDLLHIPNDIGSLCSLEVLNLNRNNFDTLPPSINQLMKLDVLRVQSCKKLQLLPELPPAIGALYADDCTSLERISPPEQSTSSYTFLAFDNCFKLVESYGSHLAIMMLKLWLQIHSPGARPFISPGARPFIFRGARPFISHGAHPFIMYLPGSKIPKWFIHKSNTPSIKIGLPPHWLNNKLMGIAFAEVFDISDLVYCYKYDLHFDKGSLHSLFLLPHDVRKSDHVLLWFFLREQLDEASFEISDSTYVHAKIRIKNGNPKVKSFGIHLLYKEDLEYFDRHHLEEPPQV
ncbi:disease resistance-like protein DSC1 [Pistacia vera]|uniref:disease resistance-like protein DSC1 n=1 Tax=Pistacia vera TaxID=55513 RepID=UPI001262E483|nr:disease resistance-like protein DSC1 [Pistacia vera]